MATDLSLRNQLLLEMVSGRRDRFGAFVEEFEQNIVNKRLRWEESIVDTSQASLSKVSKQILASLEDDSKRPLASKELARFEMGPIHSCSTVIETCFRETVICKQQLSNAESEREATLGEIDKLKQEVELARTLPKDEVERLAKECNKLPSKRQTDLTIQLVQEEMTKLTAEREKLRKILQSRKEKLVTVAQALEEYRQHATESIE